MAGNEQVFGLRHPFFAFKAVQTDPFGIIQMMRR